jgi:hypothetical protein
MTLCHAARASNSSGIDLTKQFMTGISLHGAMASDLSAGSFLVLYNIMAQKGYENFTYINKLNLNFSIISYNFGIASFLGSML